MKRLCYLGVLKEGLFSIFKSVMLISKKVTQIKRLVTVFRHLNVRIAKNNLAYPSLKDTFSVLRSSRCEVLSVLDVKIHLVPYEFQKIQKDYVECCHILVVLHICTRECLWD